MSSYRQAYDDHAYLWNIGPASDMTGGYVETQDLDKLLANPTKIMARRCLINQIQYWFQSGTEDGGLKEVAEHFNNSAMVQSIADRYGCDTFHLHRYID